MLPSRPNPSRHIQPLRAGDGTLPWTSGFDSARDAWTSGWRAETASFVSAIRSEQELVRFNSASFGAAQLQGFGSTKSWDYVAERWKDMAGLYIVGGGDYERKVVSQGAGGEYRIEGLDAWLAKLDGEVRARVLRSLDETVAPWLYRAVFFDEMDLRVTVEKDVWVKPDGTTGFGRGATREKRRVTEDRHYQGWPVWSGFSRSNMTIEWIAEPSNLRVLVRSRAPYTLAAGATRAAWYALKRKVRTLISTVSAKLRADLGDLHG